jgi:hypothetical protein
MTDEQTIPSDDVLREAARRTRWGCYNHPIERLREEYGFEGSTFRALCDALTQPAWEPPVSPELRAVREAVEVYGYKESTWVGKVCLRAIELCDQYRKEV